VVAPEPVTPAPDPKRSRHGRSRLPSRLPVQEIKRQVVDRTCGHCGSELKAIGEVGSERLDYVPGHFVRLNLVREKCACPSCPSEGVRVADVPHFAIDRALCGDGLLAHVLTSKFADHDPLNRQAKQFARAGVTVPLSTMCGWVKAGAHLLQRVVAAMKVELLAGDVIASDATGMPVLEGDQNHRKNSCLWVYGNEDHVIYEGFTGTLLCDGAANYNDIARTEGIRRAGCWAHCRRYFFEALTADRDRATMAMAYIRKVFEIEREIKGKDPDERRATRAARARPILDQFSTWLTEQRATAPPSSPFGRAVTYAVNQWESLQTFLTDGAVPADNNRSERSIRGPVVARKNWLFAVARAARRRPRRKRSTNTICLSAVAFDRHGVEEGGCHVIEAAPSARGLFTVSISPG
jgi:transposase